MRTSSNHSHPRRLGHNKGDSIIGKLSDHESTALESNRSTDPELIRALSIARLLSPIERRELREYGLTCSLERRLPILHASIAACHSTSELCSAVRALSTDQRCLPGVAPLSLLGQTLDATTTFLPFLDHNKRDQRFLADLRISLARFFIDGGLALKGLEPYTNRNERRPFGWFLSTAAKLLSSLPAKGALSPQLREETESFLDRVRVFHRFGILFIHGSETKAKAEGRWERAEIEELVPVLEALPPWLLLGTPLLRSIVRHPESPHGWQACRANTGEIEIFDQSFWNTNNGEFLDGWRDSQVTFCHEIGHAFHFGDRYDLHLHDDGAVLASGNPTARMAEFAELSSWRILRKRPTLTRHGANARLLGIEVPLDVPHNLGAEARIQFSHDAHAPRLAPLWAHNPDAGFTFGPNAHRSPWEDFADSFCTYFLTPADLQQLAPSKFNHFERIFNRFPAMTPRGTAPQPAQISPLKLQQVLGIPPRRLATHTPQ